MFHKLLDAGAGRRQRRLPAARHQARGRRARPGARQARHRSRRTPSSRPQVYVLSKDEGGRHTPFFTGYRPQFYIRTTDVTGTIALPEGMEMCMPGDNIEMGDRADHPDRRRGRHALRHPRGRPHRGCRRRHQDRQIGNRKQSRGTQDRRAPEDPHPPQGIRSPRPRPGRVQDRGDGDAHGRACRGPGAAADRASTSTR